jgi:hypothetical protein
MPLLDPSSLFNTVDNVSEALFFGRTMGAAEKSAVADFIVDRQGKPHAYGDTFAPTEADLRRDLTLFTGDKIRTAAGKCHVIGEEAGRILRTLGLKTANVERALTRADAGMRERIERGREQSRYGEGMYCCKSCSSALWLNLAAGGLGNDEALLDAGMRELKRFRDGTGRWKGFPYYYVLYVLGEAGPDTAGAEIRYTAPSLERLLKRPRAGGDKYDARRRRVCERLFEMA